MDPTKHARNLIRLTAVLTLALLTAPAASAQLALPTSLLPGIPGISADVDAPGASVYANAGGHAVGACFDVDPDAIAGTATGALPGPAQQLTGTVTGLAGAATGSLPVGLPALSDLPLDQCVKADADDPIGTVEDATETVQETTGFLQRLLSGFRGLF